MEVGRPKPAMLKPIKSNAKTSSGPEITAGSVYGYKLTLNIIHLAVISQLVVH